MKLKEDQDILLVKGAIILKQDAKRLLFWCIIILLVIIKIYYFGINYYQYMDDNNQYGIYNLRGPFDSIQRYRANNIRALAFLTDIFIISPLWNNMWFVLLTISILQVLITLMLYDIFKKSNIVFGELAIIIFNLLPLLFESTYWISASSRIVIGMFLSVLSNYLLLKTEMKEKLLGIIIILNIISMCYYEQIAIFNFLFTCYIIFLNEEKLGRKMYLIPLASSLITWYPLSNMTLIQSRGALIKGDFIRHSFNVLKQLKYVLLDINWQTLGNSFNYGIKIMNKSLLLIPILLLFFNNKTIKSNENNLKKLLLGIIILITPILPFFILENIMIYPRNMYLSILGLAIIIEIIIDNLLILIKNINLRNLFYKMIIIFITIWFIPCNIAELNNYKIYREMNDISIERIIALISKDEFKAKKDIIILYDKNEVLKPVTSSHYEASIQAGWAVMGEIQVKNKNTNIGKIITGEKKDEQELIDSLANKDYILIESSNDSFIRRK
jgi:hypothetical protein